MAKVQMRTDGVHTAHSFASTPVVACVGARVLNARLRWRADRPGLARSCRGLSRTCRDSPGQEEPMTGISTRRSGWPVLRTPRWMLAGAVVLVAGLALAALPHHPSTSQRATDLRGAVQTMNEGIESCAGGVSESLTALHAIQAGTSHDVKTAVN